VLVKLTSPAISVWPQCLLN